MIISNIARVFKFAFQNFWRNIWLSMATIIVLVLALVSVNTLVSLNVLAKSAVSKIQKTVELDIHLKPSVSEEKAQAMRSALLSLKEVGDIEYISAKDALNDFVDSYKRDKNIASTLSEIGKNPFGVTLVIKAKNIQGYEAIISSIKNSSFTNLIDVADYADRQAVISRIESTTGKVSKILLLISIVFLTIAALVIIATIRMSIYARREEIAIMRLVGAPNWFIRGPLYGESFLWSSLAIGITGLFTIAMFRAFSSKLDLVWDGASAFLIKWYTINGLILALIAFLIVLFLTMLATRLSSSRYIKL